MLCSFSLASRGAEGVGDGQVVGVHAVDELVAHGGDGADALLRAGVDPPLRLQRGQQLVQPVP